MRRSKLEEVARKAYEDKVFFRALLRDPDAALTAAELQLTPKDLRTLKQTLKRPPTVKGVSAVEMLAAMHRRSSRSHSDWFWPGGPWRPFP